MQVTQMNNETLDLQFLLMQTWVVISKAAKSVPVSAQPPAVQSLWQAYPEMVQQGQDSHLQHHLRQHQHQYVH